MSTLVASTLNSQVKRGLPQIAELDSVIQRVVLYYLRARQRCSLLKLDDRMLKDIGISKVDAIIEARKPFWKP